MSKKEVTATQAGTVTLCNEISGRLQSPSLRAKEIYFAECNQVKRHGELLFMNSRNHVDKSAVEAGKRAAFILVAALTLTLHSRVNNRLSAIPPSLLDR